MVMRITKFASVQAASEYYTSLHGQDEQLKGVERSGQFDGRIAEYMDIQNGNADREIFKTLANGKDPRDHAQLVRVIKGKERVPGWDVTFSPDKSVSVAWAAAPNGLAQQIESAQREASQTAMRYLEQNFAMTRSGARGVPENVSGLIWSRHDHFLSRALDPQLHTHNFVFNMALKENGKFGALHSNKMYKGVAASQMIYRAELANHLERIGFPLHMHSGNNFAITGIRSDVLLENSNRRQQILEATADYKHKTARSFENAAKMTRDSKVKTDVRELLSIWQERNDALGFTSDKVTSMVQPTQGLPTGTVAQSLLKALEEKTGHKHTLGRVEQRALPAIKGTTTQKAATKTAGQAVGGVAKQVTRQVTRMFAPGQMLRMSISATNRVHRKPIATSGQGTSKDKEKDRELENALPTRRR